MAQSQTERKRAERVRKKKAGLMPVQVWVMPADAERVRKYAERLNKRSAPLNNLE